MDQKQGFQGTKCIQKASFVDSIQELINRDDVIIMIDKVIKTALFFETGKSHEIASVSRLSEWKYH